MSEEPPAGTGPPSSEPSRDDPLVPGDFGGWCSRVLGVWSRSWQALWRLHAITAVLSALYWAAIAVAIPNFAEPETVATSVRPGLVASVTYGISALGAELVLLVVGAFVWAAAVFVVVREAAGRPTTATEGLLFATRRALPLMGWWLLAGLLVAIGLVMLIVPGLILLSAFYATLLGVVVVERRGVGRSLELVSGRFWRTTGRMLIASLVTGVVGLVAEMIADLVANGFGGVALAELAQAGVMVPVNVLLSGVAVVTYAELREHDDGCTTGALAAQLTAAP